MGDGLEKLRTNDFRGCCMVTCKGKVLYSSVTGFSDFANQIPNEIETKFVTASAGKVFVAVTILQLIENNMLRFDDTLGKILDFKLNYIDPNITVKHLLTHTSLLFTAPVVPCSPIRPDRLMGPFQ